MILVELPRFTVTRGKLYVCTRSFHAYIEPDADRTVIVSPNYEKLHQSVKIPEGVLLVPLYQRTMKLNDYVPPNLWWVFSDPTGLKFVLEAGDCEARAFGMQAYMEEANP